jgi:hypothetical protein
MKQADLCQHLTYVAVDLDRATKTLDVLKLTVPNYEYNPHWQCALSELANARQRLMNIQAALAKPETVAEIPDLPAAAPPPEPCPHRLKLNAGHRWAPSHS